MYAAVSRKNRGGGFVLGACFTPHKQENDGEYFGGGGVSWKMAVVVLWWVAAGGDKRRGERGKVLVIL